MRILIMAAALVATPVAAATEQFDLLCEGSIKTSPSGRPQPIETRYRIDTISKTYCRDGCTEVKSLQQVTPAELTFQVHDRSSADDLWVRHTISRSTGVWKDFIATPDVKTRNVFSPGIWRDVVGTCIVADFSGFPAKKF